MNTELIIPAAGKIEPKPTVFEIISAAITRANEQAAVQNEVNGKERERLRELIRLEFPKAIKRKGAKLEFRYLRIHGDVVDMDVYVRESKLDTLRDQYNAVPGKIHVDEAKLKRELREKFAGRRKGRLLESPQMVAAIDALLADVNGKENA